MARSRGRVCVSGGIRSTIMKSLEPAVWHATELTVLLPMAGQNERSAVHKGRIIASQRSIRAILVSCAIRCHSKAVIGTARLFSILVSGETDKCHFPFIGECCPMKRVRIEADGRLVGLVAIEII